MADHVDPFSLLTPEEQKRRMEEIERQPQPQMARPIPAIRAPAPKPPMSLWEKIAVGTVFVVGLPMLVVMHVNSPPADGPRPAVASRVAAPKQDTSVRIPAKPVDTSADPSPPTDTPSEASSGSGIDFLTHKAEAEDQLKSKLTDDRGVHYRDVQTRLSTLEGGGIVAFCGSENSRTPLGGYGGFQRFIASRSVAINENQMTPADFEQAWTRFCTDGVIGPKVWF